MKLNIKTLAASMLVGLALVSCNNDFDENDLPKIQYPEQAPLGMWTRQYTPAEDASYTLNFTVTEAGDTVCDLTTFDPSTNLANVYSNGKLTYDKKVGMITANYEEDAEGSPARATITYSDDKKSAIVNIYNVGEDDNGNEELVAVDNFVAVPSDTISVLGRWQMADGKTIALGNDGKASVVNGEEVLSEGTYTFSGKSGSATVDGVTYNLNINDKGQMYFSANGVDSYATHVMTPLPDDWTPFATGSYSSSILQNPIQGVDLEYSASRRTYRLNPYGTAQGLPLVTAPTPFRFTIDMTTGVVKMKTKKNVFMGISSASLIGKDYGLMRLELATAQEIKQNNAVATSDKEKAHALEMADDVIYFPWKYVCDAGPLTFTQSGCFVSTETYLIDDYYAN